MLINMRPNPARKILPKKLQCWKSQEKIYNAASLMWFGGVDSFCFAGICFGRRLDFNNYGGFYMSTKSITSRSFWTIIIGGMLTGMGNGSVFGATLMCLLGRGGFEKWGGIGLAAYDPVTFSGFMQWTMFIFGFAFCGIMVVGLSRHDKLEKAAG